MAERKLGVGVIGCGDYARLVHLPHMRADGRYRLVAVCDVIGRRASDVARRFGAERVCTDAEEIFAARDIDLVLITTRHDTHAELSIRAARAGKAVLCEKPMGVTLDSCRAVYDAFVSTGLPYSTGFDRNQSPLMRRLRQIIARTGRPCIMFARMQTDYPEERHWLLDESEGGGKVVGEACHLFDLLCELAGADPIRVSGEGGIFTRTMRLTVPDSAAIVLGFASGSVGCVVTSSVGNRRLHKERLEVFCNGTAIVADRFKRMRIYEAGGVSLFAEPAGFDRKAELIRRLADALLDGAPLPNGVVQAYRAAVVAFKAHRAIATGEAQTITAEELRPKPEPAGLRGAAVATQAEKASR